ncbi:sigma-70 family RNA polymerase sigma factor [Caulobacter segnis]|uniref:RNA polymerase sigma factor n=1 Tax=Caulobacter segnis TaxID=88688 RepID=UPI00241075AB|nr:sigma-70 family RNA polymerase sigma factor [Caulobacter segnis]MDG2520670.1 sigma-70 family RNA polymerase sigma factor [Caulobacter segnis]
MLEVDKESWASLLGRLKRRLWPSADGEELLQAAYLRLHRYRQTHAVQDPEAFLLRTAVNIGIDQQRRGKWIDHKPFETVCASAAVDQVAQDEALVARERLKRVREGLDRLSPTTRRIFLMQRVEGKKYREIAQELGISQSAVEKHIAKAAVFLATWSEGW